MENDESLEMSNFDNGNQDYGGKNEEQRIDIEVTYKDNPETTTT